MSDDELLKEFRENRSEEAFATLMRRYAGLVYSVAKRRLPQATAAEDITQLVFIRLAKTPPKVRSSVELAAWLHRTTINVTIDTWRSEVRRNRRELDNPIMEPVTSENTIWTELSPNLDEALNQLNDEDRQILLLRFFGKKTMRVVGTEMGVSEDAAKMRVSRALERMRKHLLASGVVCSGTALGAILIDRAVEGVPEQFLSRLASIKLPTVTSVVGTGLLGTWLRFSKLSWVTGVGVTALIVFIAGFYGRDSERTAATGLKPDSATNLTVQTIPNSPKIKSISNPHDINTIKIVRPIKMLFHVLDAETDNGLSNVKVEAAYFGPGGEGEGDTIYTDKNGTANILEPADMTKNQCINVFVVAEGHVPKSVSFHNEKMVKDYVVKLDTALTAGGLVIDEMGRAVAGVKILIQGHGNVRGQSENIDFQTCPVTSGKDGSWSCSYIPRDFTNEIQFVLDKKGYAATFPSVPVRRVNVTNLILVINQGFVVTGQITDWQNQPVDKASIKTVQNDEHRALSTKTDRNGFYTLRGVPGVSGTSMEPPLETNELGAVIIHGLVEKAPLHVELVVRAEGMSPQTHIVMLEGGITNVADFSMSLGNIFRGQVVDETGQPISNVVVQTDWDNRGIRKIGWSTRTDGAGRFEWDSAPEGKTLFWIEKDGYQLLRMFPLTVDGSDHKIVLAKNPITPLSNGANILTPRTGL